MLYIRLGTLFGKHLRHSTTKPDLSASPVTRQRVRKGGPAAVQAGLQGCYNDRPFAGFPAGHLRIVQAGSGPGPVFRGVRLYVATVVVALMGGRAHRASGRPFDFASIPPAAVLVESRPDAPGRKQDDPWPAGQPLPSAQVRRDGAL